MFPTTSDEFIVVSDFAVEVETHVKPNETVGDKMVTHTSYWSLLRKPRDETVAPDYGEAT